MEHMQNPARALALQILNKTDSAGQYTNLALDAALKRSELSAPDKALVTILVYGVTERRLTLDYMADALASRPMESLDGTVRNLVRMGLYQLRYLDRIPAHAAINETVDLAPRRARGFVNAVLREYTRRQNDLPFPDKQTDLLRYLSVTYSLPVPLCKKLVEIFGAERAEAVMEAFGHAPPITLRGIPWQAAPHLHRLFSRTSSYRRSCRFSQIRLRSHKQRGSGSEGRSQESRRCRWRCHRS